MSIMRGIQFGRHFPLGTSWYWVSVDMIRVDIVKSYDLTGNQSDVLFWHPIIYQISVSLQSIYRRSYICTTANRVERGL